MALVGAVQCRLQERTTIEGFRVWIRHTWHKPPGQKHLPSGYPSASVPSDGEAQNITSCKKPTEMSRLVPSAYVSLQIG